MTLSPAVNVLPPLLGEMRQLGYVVRDLDAAIRFWTETLKVGPFVVIEEAIGDRDYIHRGTKSDVKTSLGFAYCGEMQLELVQQVNSAPSPYMEFLEQGREGLHHVAFYPGHYEKCRAELVRMGLEEVAWVQTRDGQKNNSFFEGPPSLGYMLELTAVTAERIQYYSGFKQLAAGWDGTRPIRRYRTRADYMASEDFKVQVAP